MHHCSFNQGFIWFFLVFDALSRQKLSLQYPRLPVDLPKAALKMRVRPSGAVEQAVATKNASCLPSSLRGFGGCGRSSIAYSSEPTTNFSHSFAQRSKH